MIIQVYDDDLLNGEGIREVVFLQGCGHHCKGCFSPETWTFKPPTEESKLKDHRYYEHLEAKFSKNYISGLTITGGDPLDYRNAWNTTILVDLAKKYNKNIWIYTGFTFEELLSWKDNKNSLIYDILTKIDVLCDGEFKEDLKSPNKPWVGSENQRVIDVQKSLKENKVILYA